MTTPKTAATAIWQAMTALGGERSIREVTEWIEHHHGPRWKDIGTPMADLAFPGNESSKYTMDERFLERRDAGRYRIRQEGAFRVA